MRFLHLGGKLWWMGLMFGLDDLKGLLRPQRFRDDPWGVWSSNRCFPALSQSCPITMFWKFDLNTTSHVDKLLDKEDVTLEELMDEDDVLQECKAQNRRLLDFLCQQHCMEQLVTLITHEPPVDMDEKVRFK